MTFSLTVHQGQRNSIIYILRPHQQRRGGHSELTEAEAMAYSIKSFCPKEEKIALDRKYFKYLYKTETIVFIIIFTIAQARFRYSIILSKLDSFRDGI